MKEIIYLDTGVLHSFLAQSYDGLPTEMSNERDEEVYDSLEKDVGFNSASSVGFTLNSGEIEIPLIFKTPEGEIHGIFQPGRFSSEKTIMSQTESGREIISKQLHDNALTKFEEFLKDEGNLFSLDDPISEGNYITCKSDFKIIDFKYLKSIMQSEKMIKFMFFEQEETIENLQREINDLEGKAKGITKARLQQLKRENDSRKALIKTQFKFIEESLEYLTDILPTDSFIVIGNTIAPLKNEYLREKASELSFKYGNSYVQITMIGKVTRIVDNITMPSFDKDAIFDFPKIITYVLHPLGLINPGDIIVSPIAIYFEEG